MDNLTRLLLLELGFDADNLRPATYDDNEPVFDGEGLALIHGHVSVKGSGKHQGLQFHLKPRTYKDGAFSGRLLFSPHDAISGSVQVIESAHGLGLMEFEPESKKADLEFFFGDTGDDNFVSMKISSQVNVPWLYLPRMDTEKIDVSFLDAVVKLTAVEDWEKILYSFGGNHDKETWYKLTAGSADITVGKPLGSDHHLVILSMPGRQLEWQHRLLSEASRSFPGIDVPDNKYFPPSKMFEGYNINPNISTYGCLAEVEKGSGFQIPGFIDEVLRRST